MLQQFAVNVDTLNQIRQVTQVFNIVSEIILFTQSRPVSQQQQDPKDKKNAKAPGPPAVKPLSAEEDPNSEESKRKSKLRDKLPGKSETKVPTVDDEPPNGPEAYLGIFDVMTPSILESLQSLGVFIDVVINVRTVSKCMLL